MQEELESSLHEADSELYRHERGRRSCAGPSGRRVSGGVGCWPDAPEMGAGRAEHVVRRVRQGFRLGETAGERIACFCFFRGGEGGNLFFLWTDIIVFFLCVGVWFRRRREGGYECVRYLVLMEARDDSIEAVGRCERWVGG